jgi:hypothetical protein
MRDSQNITIALLLATAAILGTLLVGSYATADSSASSSASVKGGDYILGTVPKSNSQDFVYVVDIAARRLNLYETNINTWSIDMTAAVDLDRVFEQ